MLDYLFTYFHATATYVRKMLFYSSRCQNFCKNLCLIFFKHYQLCCCWSYFAFIKDHALLITLWLIFIYILMKTLYYTSSFILQCKQEFTVMGANSWLLWVDKTSAYWGTGRKLADIFLTTTLKHPLKLNGKIPPVTKHNAVLWKLLIVYGLYTLGRLTKEGRCLQHFPG